MTHTHTHTHTHTQKVKFKFKFKVSMKGGINGVKLPLDYVLVCVFLLINVKVLTIRFLTTCLHRTITQPHVEIFYCMEPLKVGCWMTLRHRAAELYGCRRKALRVSSNQQQMEEEVKG